MGRTKTIAVTEDVWARLRQVMRRNGAKSMNELLSRLIETGTGTPQSKFGVHKKMKLRITQEEHEEITPDRH
jgi:predicted CopG family antitoxin